MDIIIQNEHKDYDDNGGGHFHADNVYDYDHRIQPFNSLASL